jgi:hypothetical protein
LAEVAVTARDRNDGAGWKDAWSDDDTLVDRALEPERRPTHVANGGKTTHQRVSGLCPRHQVQIAEIIREQLGRSGPNKHRMPMRVDEARHERTPTTDDDLSRGAPIDLDGIFGDFFDGVAANEDVHARAELIAFAVENTNVLEQRECGWLGGVRGVHETKYSGKGEGSAKHRSLP